MKRSLAVLISAAAILFSSVPPGFARIVKVPALRGGSVSAVGAAGAAGAAAVNGINSHRTVSPSLTSGLGQVSLMGLSLPSLSSVGTPIQAAVSALRSVRAVPSEQVILEVPAAASSALLRAEPSKSEGKPAGAFSGLRKGVRAKLSGKTIFDGVLRGLRGAAEPSAVLANRQALAGPSGLIKSGRMLNRASRRDSSDPSFRNPARNQRGSAEPGLLARLVFNTIAVMVAAYLLPGVHVTGLMTALVAGIVLAIVNSLVKPVMTLFSIPLIIATLGLFYLVVTGLSVMLASAFVAGFTVDGLGSAILFAIVMALVNMVLRD